MTTTTFAREMHKEWERLETLMTGDFFAISDCCDSPLYFLVDDEIIDGHLEVYAFGSNCFTRIKAETLVLRAHPTKITYELVC